MSEGWSLILHGGAGDLPPERRDAARAGARKALDVGVERLRQGASAVDVAEAVVRALEDEACFNAGYGSVLNRDGEVEMDAAIMAGATLDIGGVGAIRGVRNPISVARAMLTARPTLLVGEGARMFAKEVGAELCDPAEMIAPYRKVELDEKGQDTVGCVVRDADGRLVAAGSTGGMRGKHPGRVGDSPLPGCGLYADDRTGATALSGEGERIARMMAAARIIHAMESAPAQAAVDQVMQLVGRIDCEAGAIAIDARGGLGWAHNSEDFAVAHARADGRSGAFLSRSEDTDG